MEKKKTWWWNSFPLPSFILGVLILLFLSSTGGALSTFVIEGGESFPFLSPVVESSYKNAQLCFQKATGYFPSFSFRIVVLSSETSKTLPSWMAAFSRGNAIYIRSPLLLLQREILSSTLAHEFFHIFIESYGWRVPFWFEEGMASFFFPAPGVYPEGETGEFYQRCEKAFETVRKKIGKANFPSFFSAVQDRGFDEALFLWTGEREEDFW